MKLKITSKEKNPLIKRTEVKFNIEHAQTGGTPSRAEIRTQLAAQLNTKLELVYVKHIETKTGTMVAIGEANAYDSAEQAKLVEPKHIITRNAVPEKPAEPAAPEAQEEVQEESSDKEEES